MTRSTGSRSPLEISFKNRGTFSAELFEKIAEKLSTRSRKTSPFRDVPRTDAAGAHWVRPDLVAEVEFAEWTKTARLRQPTWRGWRPGKKNSHLKDPKLYE